MMMMMMMIMKARCIYWADMGWRFVAGGLLLWAWQRTNHFGVGACMAWHCGSLYFKGAI